MSNYEGKDNYGKPKSEYLAKLGSMTEYELLKETENKIWLSAFASNNPRSDYHWHADACYDEWKKRGQTDKYHLAWKAASGQ